MNAMRSFEDRRAQVRITAAGLIVLSVLSALIAMCLGAAQLPLATVLDALGAALRGEGAGTGHAIVVGVRLPRILSSYLVGMALSVCGACMQGLFHNPMADPHMLGVSSGAAFGVALCTLIGGGALMRFTGLFAFAFSIAAVLIVLTLSHTHGRVTTVSLLLAGIAVSSLLTALTSGLMVIDRENLENVYMWTMGSFTSSSWDKLKIAAPVILMGVLGIIAFARDLNALLMGESDARQLGVNVRRVRLILLLLSTLVTATAVSISGVIGFVGLMVPHAMRMFCGPDHRGLLPLSALAGGLYLLIMDTLARTVLMPIEIPIGVLTAMVGGPFFLYLLKRRNDA